MPVRIGISIRHWQPAAAVSVCTLLLVVPASSPPPPPDGSPSPSPSSPSSTRSPSPTLSGCQACGLTGDCAHAYANEAGHFCGHWLDRANERQSCCCPMGAVCQLSNYACNCAWARERDEVRKWESDFLALFALAVCLCCCLLMHADCDARRSGGDARYVNYGAAGRATTDATTAAAVAGAAGFAGGLLVGSQSHHQSSLCGGGGGYSGGDYGGGGSVGGDF